MKFVEVKNPKDFFEYEMDNLRFSASFFTFQTDDGKYINKQLYKIGRFPIFNEEKNIGILHKVIEERYPQDIIDMVKEDYKKSEENISFTVEYIDVPSKVMSQADEDDLIRLFPNIQNGIYTIFCE